jgi:hypothetical protein
MYLQMLHFKVILAEVLIVVVEEAEEVLVKLAKIIIIPALVLRRTIKL